MILPFPKGRLRPFQRGDEAQLAKVADNYNIWKNVRDEFPRPYTLDAAKNWIAICLKSPDDLRFAIEVDGLLQGGMGCKPPTGANYRHSVEIGYWLAEELWGQGIISSALPVLLQHLFKDLGIKRVFACAFDYNPASMRVLQKAGFVQEGLARKAVLKEGKYIDEYRFGLLAEEFEAA